MKAIFELAVPAARLGRAAGAGGSLCDCAVRSKIAKTTTPMSATSGCDCSVGEPSAPGALPRLLDQRLDEGLELLAVDRIARAGRARRGGDGHGCRPTRLR